MNWRRAAAAAWPVVLAAGVVGLGLLLGWRGVDLPAADHRVQLFHAFGFTAWDSQWYGGEWTLNYSVVFGPLAGTLGVGAVAVGFAALAAYSFSRLVRLALPDGRRAWVATAVFSVSLAVETSIGQLPFLVGEALALSALLAARRRWWPLAWALAVCASLVSPLPGFFLGLAAVAWALDAALSSRWTGRLGAGRLVAGRLVAARLGLAVGVALPVGVLAVFFPGLGNMPYPGADFVWYLLVAAALFVVTPPSWRALRIGEVLYAAAVIGSYVIPSPIGGNVERLEDCLALPVAVLVGWQAWRRVLVVILFVPLLLSQWAPAWDAITSIPAAPSSHRAFFTPLVDYLQAVDPSGISGRVEVVPTAYHWEAVYVAPHVPLARGWERQTDSAYNSVFYVPGRLDDVSYVEWLQDNGVAYVALANAPLDYIAPPEAHLVRAGVPGLVRAWSDPDWTVWRVSGSPGLVSGPGTLSRIGENQLSVTAGGAGTVLVRVHWSWAWRVTSGAGCVARSSTGWTDVTVTRAETFTLAI
ncbi:MAG: hypothetical protein ACRDYC_02965, partial [Acidimicrobiales bacterium]